VRHRRFASIAALMVVLPVLAPGPAFGQLFFPRDTPKFPQARTWMAQKAKLPPYSPPRTPDGQPDLQGVWSGPVGGGNDDIEEHEYVDMTTPPQESYISEPGDGKVPYTPWALAKRNEIRAGLGRGWPGESGERLYADPTSFCLNSMPRISFGPQEIVQKPDSVILLSANGYRVIRTDGRPHLGPGAKSWLGNSRGRWEGDTLVVEITNFDGRAGLSGAGQDARLTERFTRLGPNELEYLFTVDDPGVWERPWTGRMTMSLDSGQYELVEYACHEANYSMINTLNAVRAQEAAEREGGTKKPAAR
jgi:hypothetical protein